MRVFIYSEIRTLVGIPIRHTPFVYEFGDFEGRPEGPHHRTRRLLNALGKPSTEVQADAIGLGMVSLIGGGVGTGALATAGLGPAAYLSFAGAAAAVMAVSSYEAYRKLRFEKRYGDFFMTSIAVASADVRNAAGELIIQRGVDEICELHAIGHLDRMSELRHHGLAGRITIVLESLEGMRAMTEDIDNPAYANVRFITARSDLTGILFKLGFSEIPDPPTYDFANRLTKRTLKWWLSRRVGDVRSADIEAYRMAVMPKDEFASAPVRAAVDAQIERWRRNLERAHAEHAAATATDGAAASVESAIAD
jgi:hypothetical protein